MISISIHIKKYKKAGEKIKREELDQKNLTRKIQKIEENKKPRRTKKRRTVTQAVNENEVLFIEEIKSLKQSKRK